MIQRKQQRGAALLIVLLLAATLSFVALSAMESTTLSAARTSNVNMRGEALWRAEAIEALTLAAIDEIASPASSAKMSLDDPWAVEPIELPFDGGAARVFLGDGTACFNVTSLSQTYGEPAWEQATAEFIRLAGFLGLSNFEAAALAETIGDWIDEDTNRRPQGGEDEYYTARPSPYRAGNQPMASMSELRAVKGVTRELYGSLKPFLCSLGGPEHSVVNVNMLSERHAPVLAAMLGDDMSVQGAADIIAARPPGGWVDVASFMATPAVKSISGLSGDRFSITSRFLIARAEIVYDTALVEMTSLVETGGNGARVLSRRLGAEE